MKALFVMALALAAGAAVADERTEYYRRAAAADTAAFERLDLDADRRLTREEALPEVHLIPRFNDMDVDRDGVVTTAELERYLGAAYGPARPDQLVKQ